jgi:hypothetical protein
VPIKDVTNTALNKLLVLQKALLQFDQENGVKKKKHGQVARGQQSLSFVASQELIR